MHTRALSHIVPLTFFGAVVLVLGCSGAKKQEAASSAQLISVAGQLILPETRDLTRTFTGSLEGERQAVIYAKISEAVLKVNVREGGYIRADEPLVSLDRSGPTSSYMQAYSVYQNAEKNFNKMKYLFEQGAVSESQFDGARTDYEVSKANYDAALQMVELRSPISGMVTSVDVSPGEYVAPGMPVATVAAVEKMRMKLGVSSADIGYFGEGQIVRITVEAESLLEGEGKVIMVARSADPTTRAFQVEVEVDNADRIFKPGMFGKCEVTVGRYENILVAPSRAVLNRSDRNQVFVYAGGKALLRVVERGIDFDGVAEIRGGIKAGDTLIIIGQEYLEDGAAVHLARFTGADGKEMAL